MFGGPRKTLLVARGRGFWLSPEANIFTKKIILSSNPSFLEELWVCLRLFWLIFFYKPDVVFFGTTMRLTHWLSFCRNRKIISGHPCFITDHQQPSVSLLKAFDKIVVYSKAEIKNWPESFWYKFYFIHYPGKATAEGATIQVPFKRYVFCGGSNKRDYISFLKAFPQDPDLNLVLVTDKQISQKLPSNCISFSRLPLADYMLLMKESLFVAIPLLESSLPHGHCDAASALFFGKAVLSTKRATIEDYVLDKKNGILVEPKDVDAYNQAISLLLSDSFRLPLEMGALESGDLFCFAHYGNEIKKLIKL